MENIVVIFSLLIAHVMDVFDKIRIYSESNSWLFPVGLLAIYMFNEISRLDKNIQIKSAEIDFLRDKLDRISPSNLDDE